MEGIAMKWNLFFLFLFGFTYCFGTLVINYSNFSDNTTYIQNMGAKYSIKTGVDEYAINGRKYNTPSKVIYSFSANADWDYEASQTTFLFSQYTYNQTIGADYIRAGLGLGFIPDGCRNNKNFPYRHKLSGAIVHETNRGTFISWRYKFEAKAEKISLKAIAFMIGHGDSLSMKIDYELSKNVYFNYIYDYERLDSKQDSQNSLGVGIKL